MKTVQEVTTGLDRCISVDDRARQPMHTIQPDSEGGPLKRRCETAISQGVSILANVTQGATAMTRKTNGMRTATSLAVAVTVGIAAMSFSSSASAQQLPKAGSIS